MFNAKKRSYIQIEVELHRTKQLLQTSMENPQNSLLHSIDNEFNLLFFNDELKEPIKRVYGSDLHINTNLLESITSESEKKQLKENLKKVLSGESLYNLTSKKDEGEYINQTADENNLIWDFTSAPLGLLPNGKKAVISMAKDVTEQKRTEEILQKAQKVESLGILTGGIAHDVNN